MAANPPFIQTGTGTTTIVPPYPKRMMLVANTDASAPLTVQWNGGGPDAFPLAAGEKKGNFVKGGVVSLTITGTGTWAVELAD